MKAIRIALVSLLLAGIGLNQALADTATVNTAKSEKGQEVHPLYGGYKYKRISTTTETTICQGFCLLAGVYMQTGAVGTTFTIRDTGTADTQAAAVLKFKFVTDTATSYEQRIHHPLRMNLGISAKLSAINEDEAVTVAYIELGNQ